MSMLAERKQKQKWCLNPRGKAWSEDSNKFGQKLLEKMGWSKGKGLGANEDGIQDHVKVSYKNDSKGIGFKDNSEMWSQHEDHFTNLLKSLSAENSLDNNGEDENEITKLPSLEQKSQNSRRRVHYKKFTRGKDLSGYSAKDIANIFGKKSIEEVKDLGKVKEEEKTEKLNEDENENKETKTSLGVMLINSGNMNDYFNKHMKQYKSSSKSFAMNYKVGSSSFNDILDSSEIDRTSDCETATGFGFGFQSNQNINEVQEVKKRKLDKINDDDDTTSNKKIKKEKKQKNLDTEYEINSENVSEENMENDIVKSKKEKKKKVKEIDICDLDTSNQTPKNKDKKRRKNVDEQGFCNPALNLSIEETSKNIEKNVNLSEDRNDNVYEVVRKKSKTKKTSNDNAIHEDSLENKTSNSIDDLNGKIKRKKRKSCDDSIEVVEKKSKKNDKENGICNFALDITSNETKSSIDSLENSNISEDNPFEVKRKKKDKKQKKEEFENETINHENYYEEKPKTKKKKSDEIGFENPALELSLENGDNEVTLDNNIYEVETKQSKKKKKSKKNKSCNGIENLALDSGIEDELNNGIHNPALELSIEDNGTNKDGILNPALELSIEDDGRSKNYAQGIDNSAMDLSLNDSVDILKNQKNKKSKKSKRINGIENPALNLTEEIPNFNIPTPKSAIKKRICLEEEQMETPKKSVRINLSLNEEKIITDNDSSLDSKNESLRTVNSSNSDELLNLSDVLTSYQNELENSINEAKENQKKRENNKKKLTEKVNKVSVSPRTKINLSEINGPLVIEFPGSNLFSIHGYASKK